MRAALGCVQFIVPLPPSLSFSLQLPFMGCTWEVLLLFVFRISAHRQVQMVKEEKGEKERKGKKEMRSERKEMEKTVKEDPKNTGRDFFGGRGSYNSLLPK